MAGEGGWDQAGAAGFGDRKLKNTLPLYGNKESMNLNSMILTNILGSPYFKEELIAFKTFHEVVDEIYFKVEHLEPWERNSRKLAGQVGMCAGVRGVAAGGIVSTAFCLLYKLFTLKLTRKQLTAMINHRDSPYIRCIGLMYVRYCQPPPDFWDWFSPYIDDEEEIDLKAGGGYSVTIGDVCSMMLSKLDWFGTLFPRLPVNVQRDVEFRLKEAKIEAGNNGVDVHGNGTTSSGKDEWGEAGRRALQRSPPTRNRSHDRRKSRSLSRGRRTSPSRSRRQSRSRSRNRRKSRSHSRTRRISRSRSRDKKRSRSRERRRPRSSSRERKRSLSRSKDKGRRRQRSRSREDCSRNRHKNRSNSTEQRRRSHSKERKTIHRKDLK